VDICWPDSEIIAITLNYDKIDVHIEESTGLKKHVHCLGFIGFECKGFWDEAIIESAAISSNHPMIQECVEKIKHRTNVYNVYEADSGCEARNLRDWQLLTISLIDGCEINIVCSSFSVKF